MDQNMENDMETGGIKGVKELNSSYYIGEAVLSSKYTHDGNLNAVPVQQPSLGFGA